jgi:hypothetical protein
MNDEARTLRIRHIYRTMILRGGVRIPRRYAEMLVGPDCAYRLYDTASGRDGSRHGAKGRRGKRSKRRL